MAVDSTGAQLAILSGDFSGDLENPKSTKIYISIMRTIDGGHLSQEFSYQIGQANQGYHYVRDSAFKWSASGKLFIAA